MNNNQMVREFRIMFGLPSRSVPGLPPKKRRDLCLAVIGEEVEELRQAIAEGNLVQIADAFGDILYSAYVMAPEFGIDIEPVFAEIHRSNMTKMPKDGTPIIHEDGKVLKGDQFEPPNIQAILLRQGMKS